MTKSVRNDIAALEAVLDALEPLDDAARSWVLKTALDRMKVTTELLDNPLPPVSQSRPPGSTDSAQDSAQPTPKAFMAEKNPTSDVQRIACLAYFLTNYRKTSHFKTIDLTKLNTEAAGAKIGNAAQAVANATKLRGFLAPAGGGKKQITHFGEQVVNALPHQETVTKVSADHAKSKPRKKKAKEANP